MSEIGGQGSGIEGRGAQTSAFEQARTLMSRIDLLAGISEEPNRLTRRFATTEMRRANDAVAGWMLDAGMSVHTDNIGNLIGRYEGKGAFGPEDRGWGSGVRKRRIHPPSPIPHPLGRRPPSPTLVIGSHLDTVRDAGKLDGPLGVLAALACVERLRGSDKRLPYAIEVVAFSDEEGLRYHTAFLGSKVFAGTFDPECLNLRDADGITMAEAIQAFGGDPDALSGDKRSGDDLLGYCEVHIEQGPVLEANGLPVGVVTAIAGQTRIRAVFTGEAGHAGTVPMPMRRDALCAAAEFVLAAEELARSMQGLVATVGQITAQPGAGNVIPSRVVLTLDVRHIEDAVREDACRLLCEKAGQICRARRISLDWRIPQDNRSVPCDPRLTRLMARAAGEAGYSDFRLPSGAGHDGVVMAELTPIAMLFVRCEGGISHNPAESVEVEDVAAALDVMERFLELLAQETRP